MAYIDVLYHRIPPSIRFHAVTSGEDGEYTGDSAGYGFYPSGYCRISKIAVASLPAKR
jgi:hypothetical protein